MFDLLKAVFKDTKYFVPMSGSVISKGPADVWPALHLLDRKFWSSFWKYVSTWCDVADGLYGKVIGDPIYERIPKWRAAVRNYIFHVTAEMVPNQLPPISRYPLRVQMTGEQRKLHDSLERRMWAETPDGNFMFAQNRLTAIYQMRLAMICPKALDPSFGYGAGIEGIADDAQEGEISRYAIFTPFKAPLPYLKAYLEGRGCRVWILQGGIGLDEQEHRLSQWRTYVADQATGDAPGIILATTKYSESWEIPEASYGYHLGYEYDPEDNKQADGRLRRLISPGPVFMQYVVNANAYDEHLLQMMMDKAANRRMMMDAWYQTKKARSG